MLPRLILTSGEPAGIGPDLCIAIASREWPCELIVAGDPQLLRERAASLGAHVTLEPYTESDARQPQSARVAHRPGVLRVLAKPLGTPSQAGVLDTRNARYVLDLLDVAIDGAMSGEFDGIVTAPVQKSVISDAGVAFSGHTEYLAERTGGAHPVMMLACDALRVALVTTHLPLAQVPAAITPDRLTRVTRILDHDLRTKFGLPKPRIMVCGLNPHAGESGHLGMEEIEVIAPTLATLRAEGIDAIGPVPADTAFTPHMLEGVDAVLAMYHDQGLPVLKYAGFDRAINVTLGLPIVRTSVDHGTALSIAGTGKADPGSLIAAIDLATKLSTTAHHTRASS